MSRAVATALAILTAGTLLLRTGILDSGYWIDEAITVGIASHDVRDIPDMLRLDGSPPLFYLLLHGWMALAGTGEAATRAPALLFALLAVPVSWWAGTAVFGPPRGRVRRGGRGRLAVPHLLRAGGAHVLARDGAVRAGVRELRARVPARPARPRVAARRVGRAAPLHAQLGALPRRGPRHRLAVAVAAGARRRPRGRAAGRRRRAGLRAVGAEPRLPGRQHGRAVGRAPDRRCTCSASRAGCSATRRSRCWRWPRRSRSSAARCRRACGCWR